MLDSTTLGSYRVCQPIKAGIEYSRRSCKFLSSPNVKLTLNNSPLTSPYWSASQKVKSMLG